MTGLPRTDAKWVAKILRERAVGYERSVVRMRGLLSSTPFPEGMQRRIDANETKAARLRRCADTIAQQKATT